MMSENHGYLYLVRVEHRRETHERGALTVHDVDPLVEEYILDRSKGMNPEGHVIEFLELEGLDIIDHGVFVFFDPRVRARGYDDYFFDPVLDLTDESFRENCEP